MQQINFDLILEVRPPRNGEIEFENIRKLVYLLREQGMNLKWISFDSYQSVDSRQILRQHGFANGDVSCVQGDDDGTRHWDLHLAKAEASRWMRSHGKRFHGLQQAASILRNG
jgi:hypothetical protein